MGRLVKYIVTENEDGKQELFMFPRSIPHDAMAEVLGYIKKQTCGNWERVFRQPVSAGFVTNNACHGSSESLSLKSEPGDTDLLRAQQCQI